MAGYKRQEINGTTPQDLKNLNDNIRYLWLKTFGNIDMLDIKDDIKSMLYTNWLQINGEGNLDSTYPLYVRFFIPPNTNKIKSSNFNLQVSRYRMDSGVAKSTPANSYGSATSSGASSITSSGASSIASSSASGSFNIDVEPNVFGWKAMGTSQSPPSNKINFNSDGTLPNILPYPTNSSMGVNVYSEAQNSKIGIAYLDLYMLNHSHRITASQGNHIHDISHTHNINHTHNIEVSISIPEHSHVLNEGVKESSVTPANVKCFVNEIDLEINLGESGSVTNKDISDKLIIGQWNTIKITTTSLARITVYGIAELLQDYK